MVALAHQELPSAVKTGFLHYRMPLGRVWGVLMHTQGLTAKLGGRLRGRESRLVLAKGVKYYHQERERGFKEGIKQK